MEHKQQEQSKANKDTHQQSTHEKNSKQSLLGSWQEQIIEIMEEESKIEIPLQAVQIALAVSFLQVIVYLFKDHKSLLADGVKLEAAIKVVNMISVLNVLNIAENDTLSLLVYMILHGVMISAYLVILIKVIVLASVSNYGSSKNNKQNLRKILGKSDKYLNIFFSIFLPVLLNQYAELNFALLFCTPNSLVQSMRDASCSKSSWQIIFGVLGIILTVITALLVSYFFRNHEFLDSNPFKGRFSILSTGIIAVRLFLALFHFIDVGIGFKHVLSQVYGILSLADFLIILPFPGEEQLAGRLLDIIAFYESAVICGNLLIWSGTIIDQEAFYLFLLLGSLLTVLFKQAFILRRELIMEGDLKSMSSTYSIFYYFESLVDMAIDSLKNVEQKVKLIRYIKLHKLKCASIFCTCHNLNEATFTIEEIVDIVDNLFQEILHRSKKNRGQWGGAHSRDNSGDSSEILLLKYISFIQKMNENYTQAYYEMKVAGRKTTTGVGRTNQSMYCELVCRVLARKIQAKIEIEETTSNERLQRINGLSSKSINDFSISSMIAVDRLCNEQIAKILRVIDFKIKLWQNLQKGYRTINHFQEEAIKLTSLMRTVSIEFNASKKQLESSNSDVRNLIPFLKLTQLFNLLVKNDIPQAIKAEFHLLELKKREGTEVSEELKNSNIIKGEACVVEISLSEELGKIVSKKDSKLAGFFGYEDASEFAKIKHLQELMPSYIGSVHNDLLENYLDGESQRAKGAKQKIISAALMKDKNGFLNPISIQFEFSFLHQNDFRMQGVLLRQFFPSEYIVFGRNGKILGISQGMVRMLFRNSYVSILSGDKAVMNLHALLLFPKIIKRIVGAREAILNDLETRKKGDEHSPGRIEGAVSKRGSIKCTANPDKLFKKFMFYRSRMLKSNNNNNSSRDYKRQMSSAKNSSNNNENYKQINEIDILCETSLELLDNFLNVDLQSSQCDGNTSNGEGTERMKALSKTIGATMSVFKSSTSQVSQTIEYKTRFEYDLSYSLLSNEKEGPRRLKDIFFTLRMDNLDTKVRSKKKKLRGKEQFVRNLVVFFQASTSILPLCQYIDGQVQRQRGIPSMMSNNDYLSIQPEQVLKQSNISTQIMDQSWSSSPEERHNKNKLMEFQDIFPKKMVQMMLKQNQSEREIKERKQSDDEDTSQVSQEDDDNGSLDMEIMKDLLKQGKQKAGLGIFAGQQENKETLEAKLVQFGINDNLLSIDPFYQVKQTVKPKLLNARLATAFDSSVSTMLLLLSEHKTYNNLAYQQKNKSKTLEDGLLLQSNKNNLTFRGSPKVNVNVASPVGAQNGSSLNNKLTNIDEEMSVQPVYDDEEQGKAVDSFSMDQQQQRSNMDNLNGYQLSLATQLEDIPQNNTQIYTVFDRLETKDRANQGNEGISKTQDTQSANLSRQRTAEIAKYTKHTSYSMREDDNAVQIQKITSEVDNFHTQTQKSIFLPKPSLKQGNLLDETYANEVNLHPNVSYHDQKLDYSNIALEQQKKPSSSSTKKEENEMEDKQNLKHNKILAKMMTQRGMKQGKVSIQASAISSSRSSSSYAGFFLKDIILRAKIPSAAKYYILIMALFFTSFLTLNITNYLIIQSDMSIFATNTEILRYPRRFLQAYAKVLFGYYLELEMQINYLIDTPDQQYQQIATDYKLTGKQLYETLISTESTSMIQQGQILAQRTGETFEDFRVFMLHQNQEMKISRELEFSTHFYFLLALQSGYPSQINEDAFMYLRQNYFQFSSNILEMVDYLVSSVTQALDNLILKFLIVIICAICGIILVAFLSLPVIKAINKYEEKIIMTVTRIDLQQSETEKAKLEICKQLVSVDHIDWMSYNYFDVFATRTERQQDIENKREKDEQKQLSLKISKQKSPKIEINKTSDQLIGNNSKNEKPILADYSSNIINQSNNLLGQSSMMESSFNQDNKKQQQQQQSNQKFSKFQQRRKEQTNPPVPSVNVSRDIEHQERSPVNRNKETNRKNNSNATTKKSNFLLQSRFGIQSLKVFSRFLVMLFLACLTSAFFLVVIIYLTSSSDNLKVPVLINQGSINLHIISINLRISTELLVFDYFVRDNLWSDYAITDLDVFYNQMQSSLTQIETIQQENTQIIYGSNPFPKATLDQFKDIQEGRACNYLTTYLCSGGETLGVRQVIAEKEKIIVKYSSLLTPEKSNDDDLRDYLNSDEHIQSFVKSFGSEDEMLDQYSSLINASISTVSYAIQYFIQDYLLIGGTLCSGFILLVIIMNWVSVRNRLQRMNLLLSIIPEEKLSEDATLYMIKQLHQM